MTFGAYFLSTTTKKLSLNSRPILLYFNQQGAGVQQKVIKRFSSNFEDLPDGHYDLRNYRVPLSNEDKQYVLETINTANEEQLLLYKISKSATLKLLAARKKREKFTDLKDLILVDGIGLKKIEFICQCILGGKEASSIQPKLTTRMTKRMIQPRISDHQEITNVVGIAIKNHQVAWCQLEKVKHEQDHYNQNTCTNILTKITPQPKDQGHTANNAGITHPNLWSVGTIDCKKIFESRIDVVDLLAEVQSIMDQIPASNVYILSERHSAQQSGPASERQSTAYATAHVTGLLTVLLNRKSLTGTSVSNSLQNSLYGKNAGLSRTSGVYFVKESRITRSIHLQKGHDRWYGLRVLLALLQTGGPPGYLWGEGGCGISVPPHVSQRFRLLNSYDQHSQAAALCMALAFPAIYDE